MTNLHEQPNNNLDELPHELQQNFMINHREQKHKTRQNKLGTTSATKNYRELYTRELAEPNTHLTPTTSRHSLRPRR
jgi:hypothetical protein